MRLRALDRAATYPVVERMDGYPAGSISHWTRPMDWCIRILDPAARLFFPGVPRDVAGAIVSGPLLALCSILVLLVTSRRLFGPVASLVAGFFYAFSYSIVNVSWLGNGDHQNLQHLFLLGALSLWLLSLENRRTGVAPALSGACLGAAVWVSTESQLVFYVFAAGMFLQSLLESSGWRAAGLAWVAGLLGVLLAAHGIEHPGDWAAFEADKVSWFQLYQVLVFALFVVLAGLLPGRRPVRPLGAAGLALAVGSLGVVAVPGLAAALAGELRAFAGINVWLQNEVSEFRGLFVGADLSLSLRPALERDSWLLLALPILLPGIAWNSALRPASRVFLLLAGVATFAFEVWEIKLGHLFAMVFPFVIVAGGAGARERVGRFLRAVPRPGVFAAAAVGWCALASLPTRPSESAILRTDMLWRQITDVLKDLSRGRPGAVLAPWDMGSHIMYHAGLPVVASNYHRNIGGIRDGYRIFLGRPDDPAVRRLLGEREVRWVVAYFSRLFLETAPPVIGRRPLARATPQGLRFFEGVQDTLFWRLRYGKGAPGLRLAHTGPVGNLRTGPEPLFKIYEVVPR